MDGGTGTTELDQRLGMDKPRKEKIDINKWSSQDFPRRKPKEGDNLKQEKHVSHLF